MGQLPLPFSLDDDVPELEDFTAWDNMQAEYEIMGVYSKGHMMAFIRPHLRPEVLRATEVDAACDGDAVMVAGWAIARQHPRGKDGTVFVTIEDETGYAQVILWPHIFAKRPWSSD